MEVKIGMSNSQREISFETDLKADDFMAQIETAAGDKAHFVAFTDVKGTDWRVNVSAVLYVEFSHSKERRVGFVN